MTSVGLFFIGAVLFLNGLSLLGVVTPREAAPINALVGVLLVAVAADTALPDAAGEAEGFTAAGFLLFAFTYLWVAINSFAGLPGRGLGWYCAWAAGVSVFLGAVAERRSDDTKLALLWLLWAVLFATFFALLGLGTERLARAAGRLAIAEAVVTTTVPGALLLLGEWSDLATAWVVVATLATLGLLASDVARAHDQEPNEAASAAAAARSNEPSSR
jgi:putative amide transporter protein